MALFPARTSNFGSHRERSGVTWTTSTTVQHFLALLDKRLGQKTFTMERQESQKVTVGKLILFPFNFIKLSTILYGAGVMTSWLSVLGTGPVRARLYFAECIIKQN